MLEHVMQIFPYELKTVISQLEPKVKEQLEEIRIREERPIEISYKGEFYYVAANGLCTADPVAAYHPNQETCRKLLERVTNYSLYTMEEELRRGYITIAGGHRIGIAGRTVLELGNVRGIRDIGGFNFRIARQLIGCSKALLPKLYNGLDRSLQSTLIISPPQQGKTTLLRDLARAISYGSNQHRSMKVAIVDERSEIAASIKGVPTFDVGPRTDVMDACPKAEGMMMLLRSMSPELIVVDEIGRLEDVQAIKDAAHCGVKVIATAHAYNAQELIARPEMRALIFEKAFQNIVELKRDHKGFQHRLLTVDRVLEQLNPEQRLFSFARNK